MPADVGPAFALVGVPAGEYLPSCKDTFTVVGCFDEVDYEVVARPGCVTKEKSEKADESLRSKLPETKGNPFHKAKGFLML